MLQATPRSPRVGARAPAAEWVAPLVVPEGTTAAELVEMAERVRLSSEPVRKRA